jgi:hypothetical protein
MFMAQFIIHRIFHMVIGMRYMLEINGWAVYEVKKDWYQCPICSIGYLFEGGCPTCKEPLEIIKTGDFILYEPKDVINPNYDRTHLDEPVNIPSRVYKAICSK